MKDSLTDYATALSGSDFKTLIEIIDKKYLKFRKFFELCGGYASDIKEMEYKLTDESTLHAVVTFKKKVKLDDKKELIEAWKSKGYGVSHEISGKTMNVIITYEE